MVLESSEAVREMRAQVDQGTSSDSARSWSLSTAVALQYRSPCCCRREERGL